MLFAYYEDGWQYGKSRQVAAPKIDGKLLKKKSSKVILNNLTA